MVEYRCPESGSGSCAPDWSEKKVTVYRLIMKDTIEEKIMNLQNVKQDLANAIIEGDYTSLTQMTPEELMALLD